MLTIKNLCCIRGSRKLFSEIIFSLTGGECLYVRGENGSGKTSLLRILAGLASAETGEVLWKAQKIKQSDEYFQNLLYLGHSPAVKNELSAIENIKIQANLDSENIDEEKIYFALKTFGLQGREKLPVGALSAGQKRRVLLSRLLLQKKTLWVLDEPFTALDTKAIENLLELMSSHLAQNGIIIFTSHQVVKINNIELKELNL